MVVTLDGVLLALTIFGLRVLNNALGTVRIVIITRQQRLLAATLAFIEALIFAVVIANVVKDLSNILNLLAYCGGFAVGGYVGMGIEARFITSYVTATVISAAQGHEIALALREAGFGVTETLGEGRDGAVTLLRCVFNRREVGDLMAIVRKIEPDAFISVEEARAIQHGWVRNAREQRR
ncbi:MAG: DUF2179 domain-containing protein [Anaerolineaceae bacterium]|nr:DUF2179 domain-containing protein [Anaerolineaceae bacterium]